MSARLRSAWPALVLGASGLAFLLPLTVAPGSFPFPPGSAYSDALTAHWTSAWILRRAIVESGQIPLWNPTLLGGMPFAADPLSGLWYPPLWLLSALPHAVTLNLILWAHVVVGGLGMYRWLRLEGLAQAGAVGGALAFSGMPKLIGHVGLGHVSLVAAVAWSPWIMGQATMVGRGVAQGRIRPWFGLGLAVGGVFLADPRWAAPIGLAAMGRIAWALPWRERPWLAVVKGAGLGSLGVVTLAAGLALPLAEFVSRSTRAELPLADSSALGLPPGRLIGLFVADRGGWAEWQASFGSAVLILGLAAVARAPRRAGFWTALVVLTAVLALGGATPLGTLVTRVPGLSLLRVPARWLFLTGVGLAALAGLGIQLAQDAGSAPGRWRLAALAGASMVVLLSLAVAAASRRPVGPLIGALTAIATLILVWKARAGSGATLALLVLLVLELTWLDVSMIQPRSDREALGPGRSVALSLKDRPDGSRVFSPSYSLPQPVAAEAGIDLADGVHPLQLRTYVAAVAEATGFDPTGYSVTLPPFPTGDPTVDWSPELDAEALGRLSVSRVVSAYPLNAPGLTLTRQVDGVWVYTNPQWLPRARTEGGLSGAPPSSAVEVLSWSPNRIALRAVGPGTLVLSEVVYPGWRATVDGAPADIRTADDVFRAVELGPGSHQVVFLFRPPSLIQGLALGLAAGLAGALLWRRS